MYKHQNYEELYILHLHYVCNALLHTVYRIDPNHYTLCSKCHISKSMLVWMDIPLDSVVNLILWTDTHILQRIFRSNSYISITHVWPIFDQKCTTLHGGADGHISKWNAILNFFFSNSVQTNQNWTESIKTSMEFIKLRIHYTLCIHSV